MKRFALSAMVAVAALGAATSAQAAVCPTGAQCFTPGSTNFTVTPGPAGTFSAFIGNSSIAAGNFTDIFTFTLPASGLGSGTVTTSASILGSANDLDFTSVTINGMTAPITTLAGGLYEAAFTSSVPITGLSLNTLTVTGVSRGDGAFGGQLSFIPSGAVPEPATWAMMLVGFGAIGFAMRSAKRRSDEKFDAKIKNITYGAVA